MTLNNICNTDVDFIGKSFMERRCRKSLLIYFIFINLYKKRLLLFLILKITLMQKSIKSTYVKYM